MLGTHDVNAGLVPEIIDEPLLQRQFQHGHHLVRALDRLTVAGVGVISTGEKLQVVAQCQQTCASLMAHASRLELVGDLLPGNEIMIRSRDVIKGFALAVHRPHVRAVDLVGAMYGTREASPCSGPMM